LLVSAPPALAQTFALIIGGLCRAAAARMAADQSVRPLLLLIHPWLGRLARKFAILAARVQAGALPPPRRRSARPRCRPPGPPRLPRQFALLIRLAPGSAACFGSQLQHFLADPEMTALLEAAPRAGRLFRPLCRMLAVPLPPSLRLPPRPARATPARATSAQPDPAIHPPRKIERGSVPKPPAAAESPPEDGSGAVYVWRRWRGIRMPELWRPPKPA
jgi:hypothetical protein